MGGVPNDNYCVDSAVLIPVPPVNSPSSSSSSPRSSSVSGRVTSSYYAFSSGTMPHPSSSRATSLSNSSRPPYPARNSTTRRPIRTIPPLPSFSNSTTSSTTNSTTRYSSSYFVPIGTSSFRSTSPSKPLSTGSTPPYPARNSPTRRPTGTVPLLLPFSDSTMGGTTRYSSAYSKPTGVFSFYSTGSSRPPYPIKNSKSIYRPTDTKPKHPLSSSTSATTEKFVSQLTSNTPNFPFSTGVSSFRPTDSSRPPYPWKNSTFMYRPTGTKPYHPLSSSISTITENTASQLTSNTPIPRLAPV